ncbi:NTP transferase domain-containing protein [Streptococcus suis]|uniref:Nucleotidyl transferase family protein n=1 Tax=Streptococcus suis R61 TaxID=996306 RepID=A0AA87K5G3_STRSU|nr:NTP transferase domain-containing protein [Streptococcus suis]EHC03588.1 nucleotidyl transferase family protein [Streptococcus suis R61]MDW8778492.1 NTP transferase domain-containing protein [Streptococcus suis]HEL1581269.1 NTP transferase domain-containing protein [Streptococcus suis]HEL2729232.1 NTP transferase domain-containing protein [Streptococcus suis]HEM5089763.1 NTP transferase domain-containing protein [Streptococcus suis]
MRAIILAAGMGTRLRPLTLTTPKSLIKIGGETLIERQIKFLREVCIDEIVVVTGYLAEKFQFLVDKYGVKLVYNDKYDVYNNFYTMYLVREYLSDAYVIDADNYLHENFLKNKISNSTYFSAYKTNFKDEWLLKCNSDNLVEEIIIASGHGFILSGVSFWTKEAGATLREILEEEINKEGFGDLYWDNLVKDNISKIKVVKQEISSTASFEIDDLNDLEKLENFLSTIERNHPITK